MREQAQTFATVPDGGSVIMSGLGVNINMDGENGVPLLSDVPVLGKLFSRRAKQKQRRNLMVLINAEMLLLDEKEAELVR